MNDITFNKLTIFYLQSKTLKHNGNLFKMPLPMLLSYFSPKVAYFNQIYCLTIIIQLRGLVTL